MSNVSKIDFKNVDRMPLNQAVKCRVSVETESKESSFEVSPALSAEVAFYLPTPQEDNTFDLSIFTTMFDRDDIQKNIIDSAQYVIIDGERIYVINDYCPRYGQRGVMLGTKLYVGEPLPIIGRVGADVECHYFINKNPNGYYTYVVGNGVAEVVKEGCDMIVMVVDQEWSYTFPIISDPCGRRVAWQGYMGTTEVEYFPSSEVTADVEDLGLKLTAKETSIVIETECRADNYDFLMSLVVSPEIYVTLSGEPTRAYCESFSGLSKLGNNKGQTCRIKLTV